MQFVRIKWIVPFSHVLEVVQSLIQIREKKSCKEFDLGKEKCLCQVRYEIWKQLKSMEIRLSFVFITKS